MSYYIAADGGGSKLQAILYDDQFRIIRSGLVSGVNPFFKPVETVKANLSSLFHHLLEDINSEEITADICVVGSASIATDILHEYGLQTVNSLPEPVIGLASAFKTTGVVALSGTGSDVFYVRDGVRLSAVGGWGPLLGDEGSGSG